MIGLVLATLLLGPAPDQMLVYSFRDKQIFVDKASPMPADECFQRAADEMRFLYTYYGPYRFDGVEAVFCMTPPK